MTHPHRFFHILRGLAVLVAAAMLLAAAGGPSAAPAGNDPDLLAWWSFDTRLDHAARDVVSGVDDTLEGYVTYVEGVVGSAARFDGFTTLVRRTAAQAPRPSKALTTEAWVALAAYPWNWVPLIDHEDIEHTGYYFGLGPDGRVGLHLALHGRWQRCVSEAAVALRAWTHVAATFDERRGVDLYVNGRPSGRCTISGTLQRAETTDLLIGMNHEKRTPSHPVRPQATLPAWYSVDGILDEVKIHGRALSPDEILAAVSRATSPATPDIPPRTMPSGPAGPGRFGAYSETLDYYPEWDRLWRVGNHADVVVQFDDSPIRVVFWRGTRYSPVWVMENGLWVADQSAENFNSTDGCFEHMLDPHNRFSHVRIVENHDARVVVHWRYAPVSVRGQFSRPDEKTGWEDWTDEYFTFYPDGIGVRKVLMWTTGAPLTASEVIVLAHPGQRPEDVIHLDALTLVNLEGKSHVYSWAKDTPDFGPEPLPPNPLILVVNLKSQAKPFEIFEPGARMRVFRHETRRDVAPFPWWNHWPEAQIPSDGRYAIAPDRPSHFSLAWGGPPWHRIEGGRGYWQTWLYGTTTQPAERLAPLARSWAQAPQLTTASKGVRIDGYDRGQRAYVLEADAASPPSRVDLKLEASEASPAVNPACVIKGWGEAGARVEIDGVPAGRSKGVRLGRERRIDGRDDLVVYVERRATRPLSIAVIAEKR